MEEEKGGGASRMQCRLWWPNHILVADGSSQVMLLLGWVIPGFRNSIDIVVATSVSLVKADSHPTDSHLQIIKESLSDLTVKCLCQYFLEILRLLMFMAIIDSTQIQMPSNSEECANLSIVGHCIFNPGCKNLQNNTEN